MILLFLQRLLQFPSVKLTRHFRRLYLAYEQSRLNQHTSVYTTGI